MGALGGLLIIIMILTFMFGWMYKRAGEEKKATVYYSIGSVCMVFVVFLLLILAL